MKKQKRTMRRKLAVSTGLIVLGIPLLTSAQEITLDTIVVTASRQQMRTNELLSDVTVIEREEIEAAGPSASLGDLLARQPGLELVASGGPGAASSIYIRGAKAGHTLLLIDGLRAGSATTGAPDLSYLPLQQIERIEILRGAASSLYGSDAIGGVIQVFTRKGEGPTAFNAEAGFGSHNTRAVSAGLSGGYQRWSYSLQAANQRTHGFSAANARDSYSFNRDKDGYRNTSASGSLAYTFARDQEVGLKFLYADGWNDYDGGGASDYRQDVRLSSFNLYSFNRVNSVWTSTLRLGQSVDATHNYRDGQNDGKFRTRQTQYQWQNDFRLPVGSALLALERLEERISTADAYIRDKRHIDSIVAGWNGSFNAHRLQFDLRRDDNSQYGDKTTGFASYGYQFSNAWRANVSYGTAFKAPSFNDLYYPLDDWWMHGNPDLKPETSKNKEIALHYQTGAHHASITAYQNDVKNLINWIYDGSTYETQPENVDTARLRGVTLAYDGHLWDLDVKAIADFQDPRDRELDKVLTYRSHRHGSLSVGQRRGVWDWNLEWQLHSERYRNETNTQTLGGYALVNLQAGYRFAPGWSAFIRANNIFDKKYALNYGFNTDGANIFVGVRYQPK
ncbi:MAG: TonB-dependent receptor [Candidatus Accumulibacter sp.]|jgi:vitamin B12 transporter|nr:TonB-dependent receptor [Accumulibacter sp.]